MTHKLDKKDAKLHDLKVSVAQFEFGHSDLIFVTAAKSMHPALFKAFLIFDNELL